MMPLHPLSAAVVGGMVGVAAFFAPEPPKDRYPDHLSAATCGEQCLTRQDATVVVGDIASEHQVHMITRPGRYGLSSPPAGDAYAVVAGHIVRLDPTSKRIESVLRPVPRILD
ncbi:MAG: hypothetical protein ACU0HS_01305 [Paracoccus sp. (in: a-proteobacteria)]|uniref:hypothetical protein n=2 Tax=Paracoccus sp. TaxID=267 RepID=UPI0040580806